MMEKNKELNILDEHFEILNGITKIKNSFSQVLKQQEDYRKDMIELQQKIQKSLEIISIPKLLKEFEGGLDVVQESLKNIPELYEPAIKMQNSFQLLVSPAFKELKKNFVQLPDKIQETLLSLGNQGWYFDLKLSFPELWELKKTIAEGDIEKVEKVLIDYFEEKIDTIENSIIKSFPERGKILKAAFAAHRRKEYELSIPIFLAQTDGICMEVAGQYFFIKKYKKPSTALFVEKITSGIIMMSILCPLTNTLPINASEYERGENFKGLNRHMILHGESLDYGTRVNGLKAISLINYITQVLSILKTKKEKSG
jgi:hypothetical protein